MQKNRRLPSWMEKNAKQAAKPEYQYQNYSNVQGTSTDRVAQINARLSAANCLTYDKKIYYLTEFNEISKASQEILDWVNSITEEGKLPVGFDMEWPFTYTTGPLKTALIQFSFSTNVCYLFQVWRHKTLPEPLVYLLHHKKLLLHGNCIKNDIRKLGRDFPDVGNVDKLVEDCCDLGLYANRVLGISERWSMSRLVREFLRIDIDKDKAVRMSEWNKVLSEEQQIYAAIDVYASQLIYQKLKELEDKQKTEAENSHLLLQLQEDFKKEEVFKSDDLFTQELLVEYERIQVILNQSSASASARPSTTQEDI